MRAAWAALSLLLLPGLSRRGSPMASALGTAGGAGSGTGSGPGGTGSDTGSGPGDTGSGPGDTGSGPGDTGYVPGSVSAVFVTCPNQGVATELARALVQQGLAACVNIVPGVTSVYTWQGKLEEDSEVLMVIKTRSSSVPALSDFIRCHHPYEVPEVVALPVAQGNGPYLSWVWDSTKNIPKNNTK